MSTLSHDVEPPHATNPASPPPAPPLPPQCYGHRAANAIARFAQPFLYGSRPPSASGDRPPNPTSSGLRPRAPSPLSSKSTSHRTGIPIAALDISPYGTHAILAGRDILKTIQVSGAACAEDFNLRSHVVAYEATHDISGDAPSARHKDQLAANDVKWSNGQYDSTIATAAANGQIVIYDLNRPGVELARLHEHNRQVHRLAFNIHHGAYLLSGSQDATVRLWDLRQLGDERSATTYRSIHRYSLNNEGIRDLRWSPTNGVEFAAGTDNGVIQRWDFRKDKSPLLRINAHEKTCHSVDWHPDGKHLVSAGQDKNVKIWDFSSTDRRMKACWQLRAPQAVMNVRWRPPCWTVDGQSPGNWQAVQLATSYDQQDPRIHIWDLRRPHIPFKELDRYNTPPSAMLWHSENLLWSVGVAGMFTQTDITYASKVLYKRSPNVIAVAPSGRINLFTEERLKPRRAVEEAPEDFLQGRRWRGSSDERLSGSHSTTDGSFEEPGFLSTSFKSRRRKPAGSLSATSVASTPPSAGAGGPVLRLDESLQKGSLYRPAQYAASGHVPGIFDDFIFEFLARNYKSPPSSPGPDVQWNVHELLSDIFEDNAVVASCVGQYRLAQSWRILALAVRKELKARAETNRAFRVACREPASQLSTKTSLGKAAETQPSNHVVSEEEVARRTLKTHSVQENGSNMTTPLARPIPDLSVDPVKSHGVASADDEHFRLPVPAFAKQSPRKHHLVSDLGILKDSTDFEASSEDRKRNLDMNASSKSHHDKSPMVAMHTPLTTGFEDLEHHMGERRAAINNYKAQPRPLLQLDDPFYIQRDGLLAPSLGRHDSDESFQMFSTSTDSSHRTASVGGSFGSNPESERSGSSPERSRGSTKVMSEEHLNGTSSDMLFEGDEQRCGPQTHKTSDSSSPMSGNSSRAAPAPPLLRPVKPQPPIIHTEDIDTPNESTILPPNPSPSESYFIPSDFDPAPSEDPLPPKPWTATAMLPPLITYHTTTLSDTQTPSHLLLYLLPFFPLSSIPQPLIINILLSYHNQLTSLSLHAQAAHLRNLCHPAYPEIYDHGTYGIASGGAWCTVCRKPNKGDNKQGYCDRCQNKWAPCPICNDEGCPLPLSPPSPAGIIDSHTHTSTANNHNPSASSAPLFWAWCQICGHGGHTRCLRLWWDGNPAISEGGCATMGCLHDCVAGTRREEALRKKAAAAEEEKEGGGGTAVVVRGDEWVVGESRAAEMARGMLGAAAATAGGNRGGRRRQGQGQRSVGGIAGGIGGGGGGVGLGGRSNSGSGSMGKKVRLVVPDGDGEADAEGGGLDAGDIASTSAP